MVSHGFLAAVPMLGKEGAQDGGCYCNILAPCKIRRRHSVCAGIRGYVKLYIMSLCCTCPSLLLAAVLVVVHSVNHEVEFVSLIGYTNNSTRTGFLLTGIFFLLLPVPDIYYLCD